MIIAEFKKYAIFKLILRACLLLIMMVFLGRLTASTFFGFTIPGKRYYPFPITVALIVFIYIVIIWVIKFVIDRVYVVEVNEIEKTIYFKNLITRRSRLYNFEDFASYVDVLCSTNAGKYKEIYLLKNHKAERVISGFCYSNIEQIMSAFASIKYDGFQPNSTRILIQILLNQSLSIKKN